MINWQFNYLTGTKYELYPVPLKRKTFQGLKFKEVCMIMYHKLNMTLISLEVRVGNQVKVFVNPYDYVFGEQDYWGYAIVDKKPDYQEINSMDLAKNNPENFFIIYYIRKREVTSNKKEIIQKHRMLAQMEEQEE